MKISQDFLTAYSRADDVALGPLLAQSFSLFEDGRIDDRKTVLENLKARRSREKRTVLTWREHHVVVAGHTATFLGDVVEHSEPTKERPASDLQGWNTIVWTWNGAKWEAVYWQWQQGGVQGERDMWNAEYRSGAGFTPKPNRLLVDVAAALQSPGTALDVGMGQGRNSIELASKGWRVTGIDISDVGLAIARDTAAKRKLKIEAINADVTSWDFGVEKWDLVALIYFRPDDRELHKIATGLKHGGRIVVEGFHKPRAQNWEAGQLATVFKDGFEIERDEVVEDTPDWGTHPETLVRFVARKR